MDVNCFHLGAQAHLGDFKIFELLQFVVAPV